MIFLELKMELKCFIFNLKQKCAHNHYIYLPRVNYNAR